MSIFKMRQAQQYRDEEGGNGNNSGGGGSVDLSAPEIQAAIQAKIDAEVAGLKKKNSELIGDQKKLKETLAQFDGLDLNQIKNLQKRMEEDLDLKLIAEGKVDEVVNRRVELLKKDHNRQIDALKANLDEKDQVLKKKAETIRKLAVDGNVREVYSTLDFEPAALDDVIRVARDVFVMDDDGKVVPKDAEGNTLYSKDGKSQLTMQEWLVLMAEKKPYLRRASKGAGAQGNKGSGNRNFADLSSTGKIAEGLKKMGLG